ncbi:MAG: ABC transporter ATP-binding protein [Rhodospirillaceae bacterium]|nr:ABC transporter ATP-binding protein [Rhodospirillaceae bacterium]
MSAEGMRQLRGNKITMIFQEPMVSLNPTMTIGAQIAEVFKAHQGKGRRASWVEAVGLLEQVGIPDPARRAKCYAHELSGGMRQRAMIAMALSCRPRLLIADEPTTALDVTIQAQILELIKGLRDEYGMAVMFITHDLGVVAEIADRVAVIYCGEVIEQASTGPVLNRPKHPYTSGLLRSKLCLDVSSDVEAELQPIPGQPPNPAYRPEGGAFRPRCTFAEPGRCDVSLNLALVEGGERAVRCHRWEEIAESLVVL